MKCALIIIGSILVGISLVGMIAFHEYSVSEFTFVLGLVIAGFAYAKLPDKNKRLILKKLTIIFRYLIGV